MYTNWHDGRRPGKPYDRCSPNLLAILDYCHNRWGLTNLGCYSVRPIRGGTKWSAHAFGAGQDMSYREGPERSVIEAEVIPWLVDNAPVLGIQRVHDYWARRYWQAGRGWIDRPPGGRNDHLHVETTAEAWNDGRPVEERLATHTVPAPPPPVVKPWKPVRLGAKGSAVKKVQQVLQDAGYKNSTGRRPIVVDGDFGYTTDKRVREYQKANGLTVDGIVGPITAAAMGLV